MPTSVVFLGRDRRFRESRQPADWTNQERAELYRITDLLQRSGLSVGTDSGVSDEGDPWFVFFQPDSGDVIAHFARIDGLFVAAATTAGTTLWGRNFRELIDKISERQPLVFPRSDTTTPGQGKTVRTLFLHPAVVLTAFVATALLHSRKGLADTADHGAEGGAKDGTEARGAAATRPGEPGLATDATSGMSGGSSGFLFHAASMASAMALVIAAARTDNALMTELGLTEAVARDADSGSVDTRRTVEDASSHAPREQDDTQLRNDQDGRTTVTMASGTDDGPGAPGAPSLAGVMGQTPALPSLDQGGQAISPGEAGGAFLVAAKAGSPANALEALHDHQAIMAFAGLIEEHGRAQGAEAPTSSTTKTVARPSDPSPSKTQTTATRATVEDDAEEDDVDTASTVSTTDQDLSSWETQQTEIKDESVLKVSLSGGTLDFKDADLITKSLTDDDGEEPSALVTEEIDATPDTAGDQPQTQEADVETNEGSLSPIMVRITGDSVDLSDDVTEAIYFNGGNVAFLGYQVGVDSILVGETFGTSAAEMVQAVDGSIILRFDADNSITLIGVTMSDLAAVG
ncbi:hypothetical protein [Roseospira visakhapatnamensis]|uniref:Uncharacterized protein n=1 Tax=Roseospira visakhapatnamensis TaxID=390880 RepID=A0A7W6RER3_9PROT|nr:hypothetical protein [Roseospira visakhapatnamensis]MBB4267067.1 hypothetical protein [Roseospira visakhapatnamensis]